MRVLHVITALNLGGAETMLFRLLREWGAPDAHQVVSLMDRGVVGERIERLGVGVSALGMARSPSPGPVLRLATLIRQRRPDVIQTWMYHADLVGGLAARLAGHVPVVWGIHNGTLDPVHTRRTTRWVVAASARLSRVLPARIVSVSRVSRAVHVAAGYAADRLVVIPNGFDVSEYRPDADLRREARAALGVEDRCVLIGLVARVDPQKDHCTFVRAAGALSRRRDEARFLLCGLGASQDNPELVEALARERILDRCVLLGPRRDVPRVMNALDVATLSSAYGEAFPLVIGEAMACGVPCVVTDVGDSGYLVADTGRVVPARDPEQLARGWEALIALGAEGRRALGRAARARIEQHFSLGRIAAEYLALYEGVCERPAGSAASLAR